MQQESQTFQTNKDNKEKTDNNRDDEESINLVSIGEDTVYGDFICII